MERIVVELQNKFDYILIDCPAGIERGFFNAINTANEAIVVVSMDISSIRDADKVIGILNNKGMAKKSSNKVIKGLVKAYATIEKRTVGSYKAIEDGVVGAYKAIERGAVNTYKKVENSAVNLGNSFVEEYNKQQRDEE